MNDQQFQPRGSAWRRVLAILAATVVVAGLPALALAGHQDQNVQSFTGCLKTNGTGNGNVYGIKVGDSPLVACKAGEVTIHLSGGDITEVVAGDGLTGGGDNGSVELALDEAFQLPQACANGEIPEWNGATWECGVDDDTTYTASTGLDLSGSNAFSIEPDYRLPQGCSAGEIASWTGSAWVCTADNTGSDLGGIAYSIGVLTVDTVAADGDCEDGPGGNFVTTSSNAFVTGPIAVAAGTYKPEPSGGFRWFIGKYLDQDDGEAFYNGAVIAQVVDTDNGNAVVSSWERTESSNGDGGGWPFNHDFQPFTTTGGNYALRVQADASGCTQSTLVDALVDLYLVGT
jgi:hypothetical protein